MTFEQEKAPSLNDQNAQLPLIDKGPLVLQET